MGLPEFPKPICAVCKREVDALEKNYDLLRDETIFVVRCHGARESVAVETELFATLMSFDVGEAFTTPALPPKAPQLTS